ncbi:MAG: glycerol kinase, partial [Gammaproteobacteria bacterium]|nr:glycerol kinase [Gammaproteobacteria bacterium]
GVAGLGVLPVLVGAPNCAAAAPGRGRGGGGGRAAARAGRLCFGTIDSFLIWRFTGGQRHCTDATNASRTQLYDLAHHAWSDTLLDYFDIPVALLPEVKDCVDDFGVCDASHFGAAIPIRGVAGDQQAALVGQGCLRPGMTKSTYGTGCFLMTNTGPAKLASDARLLTTVGYRLGGETTFALEGSIFVAGVAVKWLRDRLGLIETAAETEAIARRIGGDTGGVHVVPAFTGLGAPHWRADVRGAITGLTLDDGRDEIVTATLKSVGFQTADLVAAIAGDGVSVETLRVDGGMVANDWFCQFLADVLGVGVERTPLPETTALGAAALAAVGAGLVEDTAAMTTADGERRFLPAVAPRTRTAWLDGWHAAVERLLGT